MGERASRTLEGAHATGIACEREEVGAVVSAGAQQPARSRGALSHALWAGSVVQGRVECSGEFIQPVRLWHKPLHTAVKECLGYAIGTVPC